MVERGREDEPGERAVEAHLQLSEGDVISGTVVNGSGSPTPFHGWLELMDELEAIRSAPRRHEEVRGC